ncbi:MAG: type II toxin-antitoxin system PemK/MazF family toxin [Planctomycetaceae bacterium]
MRGKIRWADPCPARGHVQTVLRPVLILSYDISKERSGTAISVALSGQPEAAGFPLTLEPSTPRLATRSWF